MAKTGKKIGRPPAALSFEGEPEKVTAWPRIAVTMRPATKSLLDGVALLQRRPFWQVLEDALNLYRDQLPQTDRSLLAQIVARTTKP